MIVPVVPMQQGLSRFLALSCEGAPLRRASAGLIRDLGLGAGVSARVRDYYLPNIGPSLESLARGRPLAPAADAGLILGILAFWNSLSGLPGAMAAPAVPEGALTARFRALGLRTDAPALARSVLTRRPSEAARRVVQGRPVTAAWYREQIRSSALWREGVDEETAPVLLSNLIHLERRSDRDFERAIEVLRPFRKFSDRVRAGGGLTPLPAPLKKLLVGDPFVRSATAKDKRRRKVLIGFLEFAAVDPRGIVSGNTARFPSFEAFQSDEGTWPTHNNFYLYFFRTRRPDDNCYRTDTKTFADFQKGHPALERVLSAYVTRERRMGDGWLRPVEPLLYEAFRLMAGLPTARGASLIS